MWVAGAPWMGSKQTGEETVGAGGGTWARLDAGVWDVHESSRCDARGQLDWSVLKAGAGGGLEAEMWAVALNFGGSWREILEPIQWLFLPQNLHLLFSRCKQSAEHFCVFITAN